MNKYCLAVAASACNAIAAQINAPTAVERLISKNTGVSVSQMLLHPHSWISRSSFSETPQTTASTAAEHHTPKSPEHCDGSQLFTSHVQRPSAQGTPGTPPWQHAPPYGSCCEEPGQSEQGHGPGCGVGGEGDGWGGEGVGVGFGGVGGVGAESVVKSKHVRKVSTQPPNNTPAWLLTQGNWHFPRVAISGAMRENSSREKGSVSPATLSESLQEFPVFQSHRPMPRPRGHAKPSGTTYVAQPAVRSLGQA